ncbi:hypothetical protein [Amycolatopsis sp. Hca4]|uniref:hypothetical protein n=1 Tax=Amycolatopsis sp. Hca4 TaxID=2742131 RepID=UPI0015929B55|nr:hypothetical protein [Amycolatopsis sp. Hca4]QKV74240.1 hypothetical protein HUT10_11025 [Amycolatopsis sp. Hca4]
MDQEALVDRALEDGARLDIELRRQGFALDSPIAAYDLNANQWILLFGFPGRMSRRQVYEQIQVAIANLDLGLDLDHIFLVKDGDPGMQELADLAIGSRRSSWEHPTPSIEVAGRLFSNPQIIRISPAQFEEATWQALSSALPNEFRLTRGDNFSWPTRELDSPVQKSRRLVNVDFAATIEDRVVLIEVKAPRRPLSSKEVLSALGQLTYYRHEIGHNVAVSLVLISMTDFSQAVRREFAGFEGFVLTTWMMGQDGAILADAVEKAVHFDARF